MFRNFRCWYYRHRRRKRKCCRESGVCENLTQVPQGMSAVITCNQDHRTVERGLYTGVQVKVMKNEPGEPNMVIAVGDARYVLDKRIAQRIRVKLR